MGVVINRAVATRATQRLIFLPIVTLKKIKCNTPTQQNKHGKNNLQQYGWAKFIINYIKLHVHTPIQCTCTRTSSSSISVVDSFRDRKSSSGLAPLLPHPSPASLTGGFLPGMAMCGRDLYLKGGVALAPSLSSLEWSL